MNFPFFIARRYLVSKKSTNAINIISFISILSVTLGTMALIIVMSALNGMTGIVLSLYNSFDPDIKITPAEGKTFIPGNVFEEVKKIEGIKWYTEALQENAILKSKDKQHICTVKGVSEDFRAMSGLDSAIVAGRFDLEGDTTIPIVLGGGVASKLDVAVAEGTFPGMIQLYIPRKEKKAVTSEEDAFHIGIAYPTGIFSLNDDFDFRFAIIPLRYARQLFGDSAQVSGIELGLEKDADVALIKEKISGILGDTFVVRDRYEQNLVLFKTLQSEKWWTFLIMVFILVIGTFNVIGCVTMLIIEKRKDLKILSAMGTSVRSIRRIFLLEAFMIIFTGAGIGMSLGLLLCWLQKTYRFIPFSEGFIIDYYPVEILGTDVLQVLAVVMITGFLAGYIPVMRLAKDNSLSAA